MSGRISQQQLESYLWGAAVLLRGTIDAGDYKQFIFPLLFFKRLCDVFDEETQAALAESGGDADFAAYPENHRFQIPLEAHWREVRQASSNIGRAIQSATRAIETANPDKLYGIFGDAQWTNKDRLSDSMLRDLIEHFSTLELTVASLPEDELGQGYEYLIKRFADDSGHTAAEFYTNRTVVHLMTEMLEPQPGESIYDPTCGSGGMLLSCVAHLRRQGREWRNVRIFGQERNLMTSSIARMNCFLHGIEDFQIVRGDTLSEPKLVQGDGLMQFDVVLANPPYSIKQWDRDTFSSDPWGRNLYGTPPQGRADYAFWQHILRSLAPKAGRCAILFPHGVLFRDAESEIRRKLIEADLIECIVGLGMNLFYNSAMPSCVVICRSAKPKARKGRILVIDAADEVTRERTQSFLTGDHINHIVAAYTAFRDEASFARVVTREEVRAHGGNLSLSLYVSQLAPENRFAAASQDSVKSDLAEWLDSCSAVVQSLKEVLPITCLPADGRTFGSLGDWAMLQKKSEWRPVRVGDTLDKTEETERNPIEAGFDRYLMVEHLDADCLSIKRWGDLADGNVPPTFYKVFRKGQILYPTRNPHLRRAAFADFDGICGEKTLTLSPRRGFHPKFLAFVFQSGAFIRFATNRRIGSTNPHVRWRDVAEFEFRLPPLDQQRRIAEILSAIDDDAERQVRLSADLQQVVTAKVEEELDELFRGSTEFLSELLLGSPESGCSAPPSPSDTGHFVLSLSALSRTGYVRGNLKPVPPTKAMLACRLAAGDFLISRSNTQELVGFVGIFDEDRDDVSFPDTMMRLPVNENRVSRNFLETVLQSRRGRLHMMRSAAGTSGSMKKINRRTLGTCLVPNPAVEVQERFLCKTHLLREAENSAIAAQRAGAGMKHAFMESVFG